MLPQATPESTVYDVIAKHGQDLLYFPRETPEITVQLVGELTRRHESRAIAAEQAEAEVKKDVLRTFIGVIATLVYADVAERLVPHIRQNRPLLTEQVPRSSFYMHGGLPKLFGSAEDFAQAGTAWFFGAAARIHKQAENSDNRYHPLANALTESFRDYYAYVAVDPAKRAPGRQYEYRKEALECYARHAATNFAYINLLDNIKVTLEILLQFGLAYTREGGNFLKVMS